MSSPGNKTYKSAARAPHIGLTLDLDPTDEEKLGLTAELKRTINEDRYPLSPRVQKLRAILAKLEPAPAVTVERLPTSKPGDRPRSALAAMKSRRRG